MKVKIEFEVNAHTSKLLKCLYDRLDILHNDLINMDSNFKDIEVAIITHRNEIYRGTPHINFHKPVAQYYNDSEECKFYNFGTCWGTKEKERCYCYGLKKYCTFFDGFRNNQKGE